jgi:formamidopyrimidine-DNA glycosylase
MIELPEAVIIARQMKAELVGKQIIDCVCNASPIKFAFFNQPVEQYAGLLKGQTVRDVCDDGRHWIHVRLDDHSLRFGDMGGRILFHQDQKTLPKKHQLLLNFTDGSALTISFVLWGFLQLYPLIEKDPISPKKVAPLGADFTFERFQELLADPEEHATKSVKAFLISKPGLGGVGNGCTQEILFNARFHPRRRISNLELREEHNLYDAVRSTLGQMVAAGGRNSERDLYDQPGGYTCILGSHAVGKPCPRCGTPIEKIQFLGGASYFCPTCQI